VDNLKVSCVKQKVLWQKAESLVHKLLVFIRQVAAHD